MNSRETLRVAASDLLDLFFPRSCLGCGDMIEREEPCLYLCSSCIAQIPWVQFPCCRKCGLPSREGGFFTVRNWTVLGPCLEISRSAWCFERFALSTRTSARLFVFFRGRDSSSRPLARESPPKARVQPSGLDCENVGRRRGECLVH